MSEQSELKLPWKTVEDDNIIYLEDASGNLLATFDKRDVDLVNARDVAALIVRAVNCHKQGQMLLRNLHTLAVGNYPKVLRGQLLISTSDLLAEMEAASE